MKPNLHSESIFCVNKFNNRGSGRIGLGFNFLTTVNIFFCHCSISNELKIIDQEKYLYLLIKIC